MNGFFRRCAVLVLGLMLSLVTAAAAADVVVTVKAPYGTVDITLYKDGRRYRECRGVPNTVYGAPHFNYRFTGVPNGASYYAEINCAGRLSNTWPPKRVDGGIQHLGCLNSSNACDPTPWSGACPPSGWNTTPGRPGGSCTQY